MPESSLPFGGNCGKSAVLLFGALACVKVPDHLVPELLQLSVVCDHIVVSLYI